MSKVGWRVDRYHHDKGESQMDHIDRRDDFQELVCIENSLLVRFGVLPSLIGVASVRRWNAHLCAPKSHSQDRVDFDEI